MIQKDHDDQMKRALYCAEVLTRGNVEEELSQDHEDAHFFPSKKAKHKVPAVVSSTNPTQSSKTRKKGKKDICNNEDALVILRVVEAHILVDNLPVVVFDTTQIKHC